MSSIYQGRHGLAGSNFPQAESFQYMRVRLHTERSNILVFSFSYEAWSDDVEEVMSIKDPEREPYTTGGIL